MPTDSKILGFSSQWFPLAFQTANRRRIDEHLEINVISAPCFLATKLEAFQSPGREGADDLFLSRDFEDMIRVIDGRTGIEAEVKVASVHLREYLSEAFTAMMGRPYFQEAIQSHVDSGRTKWVLDRIQSMTLT